ncbi:hypothetical protein O7626_19930 [Micromonospora sp. WMMD1102]|uniref:hypothetical protein n=1 Tax=Micromonospora sp. WMMD1102 TaxID=3016105 RepID=UPI0024150DF0|nr:hypothetical protein [Micromonospora sp. WMMD1102]MDG4788179.1 hypothetical protein [Micromonospora sp. WMMD1102]
MAATEASTPEKSTATVPSSRSRQTPVIPMPAPARWAARGRSASAAQAISIIMTGEVAMIVEATLVGRTCAAR